jgi:hypothetical protein
MNRDEKIMKRMQEHYDYITSLGYNVVALFLQGSQNYNLDLYTDEYMSDIDTKAIVLPTLDDLIAGNKMVSTTYDYQNEHVDAKDIRIMVEMWIKENPSYLELLFTDFKIINPIFEKYVNEILAMGNEIVKINIPQLLKCISGMSKEKVVALEHPYPTTLAKIEKFGYDPKQLNHIIRLNYFINNMIDTDFDFKKSMLMEGTKKEYLIDVKKGKMDLEQARLLSNLYDEYTNTIKKDMIETTYKDYQFQSDTFNKLQDIINRCVKDNIIRQVKEELSNAKDSL